MFHNWRRSAALGIFKQVYLCSRLHDLWTLLNLFLHLAACQSVTMPAFTSVAIRDCSPRCGRFAKKQNYKCLAMPSSAQQSAKNKLQNRLDLINRTTLIS